MFESALLVISLCIDACLASFAYGTSKIKIPFLSSLILTGISTLFLLISLGIGSIIKNFIPAGLTSTLCFLLLFLIGFARLFEGLLKNFLNKRAKSPSNIELKIFNFRLVLNVYGDFTLADLDHSKILNSKEALYLGIALSLDSLIVGLGAALATVSFIQITIFSIVFNLLAIFIGCVLGQKCAAKTDLDLSWLSGAILIILAFLKLV